MSFVPYQPEIRTSKRTQILAGMMFFYACIAMFWIIAQDDLYESIFQVAFGVSALIWFASLLVDNFQGKSTSHKITGILSEQMRFGRYYGWLCVISSIFVMLFTPILMFCLLILSGVLQEYGYKWPGAFPLIIESALLLALILSVSLSLFGLIFLRSIDRQDNQEGGNQ